MSRDSYEMSGGGGGGARLSRGSSLFGTDPQVQLRSALRNDDFTTFRKLLSYGAVDPDHVYQYPDYKSCLDLAAGDPARAAYVKLLLQHEVDVNRVNETHAAAPIHFAVQSGNAEALRAILEDDRVDVDVRSKGNTALLLAVKKIEDLDEDRERDIGVYEDMIKLLLKAGSDANAPDMKGCTPIYSAAKQGLERVIELIHDYSKNPVDLDAYKDRRQNTARTILKDSFPHLLVRFDSGSSESAELIDNNKLFYYLSRHDDDDFIRDFGKLVKKNDHRTVLSANNGISTMLQMATEKGMEKVVSALLSSGADPNATCPANNLRPIAIACQNGFHKILKMFAENESTLFEAVNGESLLQIITKGMRNKTDNPNVDYAECLDYLLKHPKININVNFCDIKDNTALHYAARNGDHETVLSLLRNGACIGLRNNFNEPPLADIHAKTLETYLDECLTTNGERPSDDDYEIHMKYKFLVYPNNSLENELCKVPLMENANNNNVKECEIILAPETDALLYMTCNEELRPLLKHPVITSFLYLKWQRISCLFYANLTFYALLWLSLILYILLGYGVEGQQAEYYGALNVVTRAGSIIGLLLLMFRELFQLLMSPAKYLRSVENWLEIFLIFVTAWIVFYDSASEKTKQQLSAVAILLSSAELVLLIGQFPTLSTNIVMLRTVSWNFFKFLLWYCILIIAFALSFYTLFRKVQVDPEKVAPNPNAETEEEEDFFLDPGKSLFKTIVMLTGEFDAGSIKFSTFPVTSHIIFIVFVFMIPIVLFNLLNGLAVSDTQAIKANAELVGIVSRVRLISYFESIFIGHAKRSSALSWMPKINCAGSKLLCINPLARRICLFPQFLPRHRIIVKPNQDNKILIPHPESLGKFGDDYEDVEGGVCLLQQCHVYRLDRRIVKNAKIVINKKNDVSEFAEVQNKLMEYERKIDSLEGSVKKLIEIINPAKKS